MRGPETGSGIALGLGAKRKTLEPDRSASVAPVHARNDVSILHEGARSPSGRAPPHDGGVARGSCLGPHPIARATLSSGGQSGQDPERGGPRSESRLPRRRTGLRRQESLLLRSGLATTKRPGCRRLREVGAPRLFATDHASPQPFPPPLEDIAWRPAQRLAPYRPRRRRRDEACQERLFVPGGDASVG